LYFGKGNFGGKKFTLQRKLFANSPHFNQSKFIIEFRPQTPTAHQPLPNCSNTMDTQRNFLIKNRTSFSMFGQRKSLGK
jgi:hypothetical protein